MDTKSCRALTASLLLLVLLTAFVPTPAYAEPSSAPGMIETLFDRLAAWVGNTLDLVADVLTTPDPDPIPPADDDAGSVWDPHGRVL